MNVSKSPNEPEPGARSRLDDFKRDYRSQRQTYDRLLYGAGPSTPVEKLQVRLFGVAFLLIGIVMGIGGTVSLFMIKNHLLEIQVVLICAAPILMGLGLIFIIRGKSPLGKSDTVGNRGEIPSNPLQTASPPDAASLHIPISRETPMERFLILFSKRSVMLLALLVVVGPVFALHWDERIGAFLMGVIFALSGTGQLVVARKDAGGIRCLGTAIGSLVLLVGVFLAIVAVLMFILGEPLHVSGG